MVRTLEVLELEELDNPTRTEMYLMQIAQTVANSSGGKRKAYSLREFALRRKVSPKEFSKETLDAVKGVWAARTGMKPVRKERTDE